MAGGAGEQSGGSRLAAFLNGGRAAMCLLAVALLVGWICFGHGTSQDRPLADASLLPAAKPERAENDESTAALAFVAACRTGQIDPRVGKAPIEIQKDIFVQPEQQITPLVRWLVQNTGNEFQKVKILHDWIADNITYDVDSYRNAVQIDSAWQNTLRRRKSVCQGYAELMAQMCQIAGVPCKVIQGHARCCGFESKGPENVHDENHAWNVVQVKGRWYLIDVTWDAGYIDKDSYHKGYGTSYLFLEARAFLHTHFPSDPQWQLLDPVCTAEEFTQLPLLGGRFFEEGLRLAHPLRRFHAVGDSVEFTIESPPGIVLMVRFTAPQAEGTKELEGRTLLQQDGTKSNIMVTFPKPGRWNVEILSKARHDPGLYQLGGTLEFESSAGTSQTFPEVWNSASTMDAYLYSPLNIPLEAGRPQEFKIRVHGAETVCLEIGNKQQLPMKASVSDPELYQLVVTVPAYTSVRTVAKKAGKNELIWPLVNFTPKRKSSSRRITE